MRRLALSAVLALLSAWMAVPSSAQDSGGHPGTTIATYTWAGTILTRDEKRDVVGLRASVSHSITDRLTFLGRVDVSRDKADGPVLASDPRTFRVVEPWVGASWDVRPGIAGAILGGTTFSIEGEDGPADARNWRACGGGLLRSKAGRGWAFGGMCWDQVLGETAGGSGGAARLSLSVPAIKGSWLVVDLATPGTWSGSQARILAAVRSWEWSR